MRTPSLVGRFPSLLQMAAILLCGAGPASAQFTVVRFTIDGGGTTQSSGGTFALGGTVGQPDAGRLSGGSFTLSGGFWSGGGAVEPRRRSSLRASAAGVRWIRSLYTRSSTGFTVTHNSTGVYTISFTTPFTSPPTVIVSGTAQCCRPRVTTTATGSSFVHVLAYGTDVLTDAPFHFIAMGP
jgi:hypothetical protein